MGGYNKGGNKGWQADGGNKSWQPDASGKGWQPDGGKPSQNKNSGKPSQGGPPPQQQHGSGTQLNKKPIVLKMPTNKKKGAEGAGAPQQGTIKAGASSSAPKPNPKLAKPKVEQTAGSSSSSSRQHQARSQSREAVPQKHKGIIPLPKPGKANSSSKVKPEPQPGAAASSTAKTNADRTNVEISDEGSKEKKANMEQARMDMLRNRLRAAKEKRKQVLGGTSTAGAAPPVSTAATTVEIVAAKSAASTMPSVVPSGVSVPDVVPAAPSTTGEGNPSVPGEDVSPMTNAEETELHIVAAKSKTPPLVTVPPLSIAMINVVAADEAAADRSSASAGGAPGTSTTDINIVPALSPGRGGNMKLAEQAAAADNNSTASLIVDESLLIHSEQGTPGNLSSPGKVSPSYAAAAPGGDKAVDGEGEVDATYSIHRGVDEQPGGQSAREKRDSAAPSSRRSRSRSRSRLITPRDASLPLGEGKAPAMEQKDVLLPKLHGTKPLPDGPLLADSDAAAGSGDDEENDPMAVVVDENAAASQEAPPSASAATSAGAAKGAAAGRPGVVAAPGSATPRPASAEAIDAKGTKSGKMKAGKSPEKPGKEFFSAKGDPASSPAGPVAKGTVAASVTGKQAPASSSTAPAAGAAPVAVKGQKKAGAAPATAAVTVSATTAAPADGKAGAPAQVASAAPPPGAAATGSKNASASTKGGSNLAGKPVAGDRVDGETKSAAAGKGVVPPTAIKPPQKEKEQREREERERDEKRKAELRKKYANNPRLLKMVDMTREEFDAERKKTFDKLGETLAEMGIIPNGIAAVPAANNAAAAKMDFNRKLLRLLKRVCEQSTGCRDDPETSALLEQCVVSEKAWESEIKSVLLGQEKDFHEVTLALDAINKDLTVTRAEVRTLAAPACSNEEIMESHNHLNVLADKIGRVENELERLTRAEISINEIYNEIAQFKQDALARIQATDASLEQHIKSQQDRFQEELNAVSDLSQEQMNELQRRCSGCDLRLSGLVNDLDHWKKTVSEKNGELLEKVDRMEKQDVRHLAVESAERSQRAFSESLRSEFAQKHTLFEQNLQRICDDINAVLVAQQKSMLPSADEATTPFGAEANASFTAADQCGVGALGGGTTPGPTPNRAEAHGVWSHRQQAHPKKNARQAASEEFSTTSDVVEQEVMSELRNGFEHLVRLNLRMSQLTGLIPACDSRGEEVLETSAAAAPAYNPSTPGGLLQAQEGLLTALSLPELVQYTSTLLPRMDKLWKLRHPHAKHILDVVARKVDTASLVGVMNVRVNKPMRGAGAVGSPLSPVGVAGAGVELVQTDTLELPVDENEFYFPRDRHEHQDLPLHQPEPYNFPPAAQARPHVATSDAHVVRGHVSASSAAAEGNDNFPEQQPSGVEFRVAGEEWCSSVTKKESIVCNPEESSSSSSAAAAQGRSVQPFLRPLVPSTASNFKLQTSDFSGKKEERVLPTLLVDHHGAGCQALSLQDRPVAPVGLEGGVGHAKFQSLSSRKSEVLMNSNATRAGAGEHRELGVDAVNAVSEQQLRMQTRTHTRELITIDPTELAKIRHPHPF
eukprot:g880.t1